MIKPTKKATNILNHHLSNFINNRPPNLTETFKLWICCCMSKLGKKRKRVAKSAKKIKKRTRHPKNCKESKSCYFEFLQSDDAPLKAGCIKTWSVHLVIE